MDGLMRIELKQLYFFAQHGMYEEEEKVGNEFEVNLTATFKAPENVITTINETVNYVEIYNIIEEEFYTRKLLLETMAMNICDKLHLHFSQLNKIEISIKKMNPPIANFKGSVGVSFIKEY